MKETNLNYIVDLTKKVDKYKEDFKPYTKSHTGIKNNFFGDEKKMLDNLNNKIKYFSEEIKKNKRNINFIIPIKELNNIKNEISNKKMLLKDLENENNTLSMIIRQKQSRLDMLEDNDTKINDYYSLYEKNKQLKDKYSKSNVIKKELDEKYIHCDQQINTYNAKIKILKDKAELLRQLKNKNNLLREDKGDMLIYNNTNIIINVNNKNEFDHYNSYNVNNSSNNIGLDNFNNQFSTVVSGNTGNTGIVGNEMSSFALTKSSYRDTKELEIVINEKQEKLNYLREMLNKDRINQSRNYKDNEVSKSYNNDEDNNNNSYSINKSKYENSETYVEENNNHH